MEPLPQAARSRGTVLVTGGARRLGQAIAIALAGEGWDVAVHCRAPGEADATLEAIRAAGRRAQAFARELSDLSDPGPWWAGVESALGPVTALVNNASLFESDGVDDFCADGGALLGRALRVNVAAPVMLARELARRLPDGAQGVVVNLLDQKLWNPNPDFLSYTLSKAALESATGLLARALAPRVRVVGVAPGITLPSGAQTEAGFAAAHRRAPLGQSSTPQDIAAAVAYLLGARAVTGTTLLVDGGQHLQPSARDVQFLDPPVPPA